MAVVVLSAKLFSILGENPNPKYFRFIHKDGKHWDITGLKILGSAVDKNLFPSKSDCHIILSSFQGIWMLYKKRN